MNQPRKTHHLITLMVMLLFVNASLIAQQVTGKVVDAETNEELPGVAILIKGTTTGTTTDIDGVYRIDVPTGSTLVFSYMGKQKAQVNVTSAVHNVSLIDESFAIDEVIVVGYGTQKKETVVGAISNVKGSDLARIGGVTNITNTLTGMVPGLTTLNYSGKPGEDGAELLIRAKSTWNGASPLVLVDGVERDINSVDVNEIESLSVLKDASATAVFGVRGGNGVIIVTTKRGREGKPVLKVSADVTLKMTSKVPSFLGSYDALWLRNQAIENQLPADAGAWAFITPVSELQHYRDQDLPYQYPDVNWRDQVLKKNVWSQKASIDVRGGTKFVKYYSALSYLYDGDIMNGQDLGQGYVPKNDYSRFNFRTNLDFMPTSTTVFSVDLGGATSKENTIGALNSSYMVWNGVYDKGPEEYPVRYADGTFAYNPSRSMENVVELLNYGGQSSATRTDVSSTFTLDQKLNFFTNGLSIKGVVNFRNYYYSDGPGVSAVRQATKYIDPRTGIETITYPTDYTGSKYGFDYVPKMPAISTETARSNVYRNLMYQLSLNYSRTFMKDHNITGLVVFKRTENAIGAVFPDYREEWAGRLTYDYKKKYLFETNGAYNGSDKFADGYKFDFFPSFAVGWVVSKESFFKSLNDYVDFFKIRYSWGRVGSDLGITKWLYSDQWKKLSDAEKTAALAKFGYPNATTPAYPMYAVANIGNPNARWETATKNDLAVETSFFNSFLSCNFDYYWGERHDIFMDADQRHIPPWFGADPIAANIGKTKEHGWELEAKINGKTSFDLNYYASAGISYSKDEIVYMEDPELTPEYQKKAGFPIGQTTSILNQGVIQSWDEMYTGVMLQPNANNNIKALPGNFRQVDYNGDGYIDANDVVPYGFPNHPEYTFSYTVGGEYKGFSLMIQFYGTKNCTLEQAMYEYAAPNYNTVVDQSLSKDMWLPNNPNNGSFRHPAFRYAPGLGDGEYKYKDGSIWRLKNVELAYTFMGEKINSWGINSLRIFVNGNNLWLHSYLNEDRETGGTRTEHSQAAKYPMTKRVNMGFSLDF